MGYGDLGDEMNLSPIHSLTGAKQSIIKVTHILHDPTFPDSSSFQRAHPFSDLKKKKKSGFSFCSNTDRDLSFTELPSPKVSDNLRNAYAFHKSVSWLQGVRQLVCTFSVAS